MADIFHNFPITASFHKVFEAISSSRGLDNWWTKSSEADMRLGGVYTLDFGPMYIWKAIVTKFKAGTAFELEMTKADTDWLGTKIGFSLVLKDAVTEVDFYHTGWPVKNKHFKISCYCWAMYLRILKRYVEHGEQVSYENRLNV
jgi:uncharacterized protein YndB with AHSA1/START domain